MPLISIDASKKQIEAVRTCQGEPEERQVLLCGPDGMGVCTWKDGSAYDSDVPNLTISSREAAQEVPPKKRKKKTGKALKKKPAKKAKAKAAAKAKASATDSDDGDSHDADEGSEEEDEEVEDKGGVPAEGEKDAAEGGSVEPKGAEVPKGPEDEPPAAKSKQA